MNLEIIKKIIEHYKMIVDDLKARNASGTQEEIIIKCLSDCTGEEFISVTTERPKNNETVILCDYFEEFECHECWIDCMVNGIWNNHGCEQAIRNGLYWMPIPEQYKSEVEAWESKELLT